MEIMVYSLLWVMQDLYHQPQVKVVMVLCSVRLMQSYKSLDPKQERTPHACDRAASVLKAVLDKSMYIYIYNPKQARI